MIRRRNVLSEVINVSVSDRAVRGTLRFWTFGLRASRLCVYVGHFTFKTFHSFLFYLLKHCNSFRQQSNVCSPILHLYQGLILQNRVLTETCSGAWAERQARAGTVWLWCLRGTATDTRWRLGKSQQSQWHHSVEHYHFGREEKGWFVTFISSFWRF